MCDADGKIVAFAVDYSDEIFAPLNTDHVSLIAAAPDLLEALKRLLNAETDEYLSVQGVRNLAHTAIAKATGQ